MPRARLTGPLPADEQILDYSRTMQTGANSRTAHMLNVAYATLKYLMLKGESDTIRLKAAEDVMKLPPVLAKLGVLAARVPEQYHQHVHLEAGPAKQLAEHLAGIVASGQEIPAVVQEALRPMDRHNHGGISVETNENP